MSVRMGDEAEPTFALQIDGNADLVLKAKLFRRLVAILNGQQRGAIRLELQSISADAVLNTVSSWLRERFHRYPPVMADMLRLQTDSHDGTPLLTYQEAADGSSITIHVAPLPRGFLALSTEPDDGDDGDDSDDSAPPPSTTRRPVSSEPSTRSGPHRFPISAASLHDRVGGLPWSAVEPALSLDKRAHAVKQVVRGEAMPAGAFIGWDREAKSHVVVSDKNEACFPVNETDLLEFKSCAGDGVRVSSLTATLGVLSSKVDVFHPLLNVQGCHRHGARLLLGITDDGGTILGTIPNIKELYVPESVYEFFEKDLLEEVEVSLGKVFPPLPSGCGTVSVHPVTDCCTDLLATGDDDVQFLMKEFTTQEEAARELATQLGCKAAVLVDATATPMRWALVQIHTQNLEDEDLRDFLSRQSSDSSETQDHNAPASTHWKPLRAMDLKLLLSSQQWIYCQRHIIAVHVTPPERLVGACYSTDVIFKPIKAVAYEAPSVGSSPLSCLGMWLRLRKEPDRFALSKLIGGHVLAIRVGEDITDEHIHEYAGAPVTFDGDFPDVASIRDHGQLALARCPGTQRVFVVSAAAVVDRLLHQLLQVDDRTALGRVARFVIILSPTSFTKKLHECVSESLKCLPVKCEVLDVALVGLGQKGLDIAGRGQLHSSAPIAAVLPPCFQEVPMMPGEIAFQDMSVSGGSERARAFTSWLQGQSSDNVNLPSWQTLWADDIPLTTPIRQLQDIVEKLQAAGTCKAVVFEKIERGVGATTALRTVAHRINTSGTCLCVWMRPSQADQEKEVRNDDLWRALKAVATSRGLRNILVLCDDDASLPNGFIRAGKRLLGTGMHTTVAACVIAAAASNTRQEWHDYDEFVQGSLFLCNQEDIEQVHSKLLQFFPGSEAGLTGARDHMLNTIPVIGPKASRADDFSNHTFVFGLTALQGAFEPPRRLVRSALDALQETPNGKSMLLALAMTKVFAKQTPSLNAESVQRFLRYDATACRMLTFANESCAGLQFCHNFYAQLTLEEACRSPTGELVLDFATLGSDQATCENVQSLLMLWQSVTGILLEACLLGDYWSIMEAVLLNKNCKVNKAKFSPLVSQAMRSQPPVSYEALEDRVSLLFRPVRDFGKMAWNQQADMRGHELMVQARMYRHFAQHLGGCATETEVKSKCAAKAVELACQAADILKPTKHDRSARNLLAHCYGVQWLYSSDDTGLCCLKLLHQLHDENPQPYIQSQVLQIVNRLPFEKLRAPLVRDPLASWLERVSKSDVELSILNDVRRMMTEVLGLSLPQTEEGATSEDDPAPNDSHWNPR
eukprot:m.189227 g.189227  ORF g.189227 m.189227 type:complete len:1307 (+) comp16740_c0_seq2:326-4246(+)